MTYTFHQKMIRNVGFVLMVLINMAAMGMAMRPFSQALEVHQFRQTAAQYNVTCLLVFGDSGVDPGNNNHLSTVMKSNFPPYGKDFFEGLPTGRFCNGRLATDFIAEALGYIRAIPAFLDPELRKLDLLHGVSFASAGSGYDELTANLSNVLPLSKQLQYFEHYKIQLSKLIGLKKAEDIIRNSITVLCMGTNDFLQNYFLETFRPKQYSLEQYENYLVSSMFEYIKRMHLLGIRRLVVVGVPPLGCMPAVKTLMNQKTCVEKFNQASSSLNSKIKARLATAGTTIGVKTAYLDAYGILQDAVKNPKKYGLIETSRGCCATGTFEYGTLCKEANTCADASKYAYWDAVHPSETMYKVIADEAIRALNRGFF